MGVGGLLILGSHWLMLAHTFVTNQYMHHLSYDLNLPPKKTNLPSNVDNQSSLQKLTNLPPNIDKVAHNQME